MKLSLYKPALKDLWYRQSLVENEDTMSFNDNNGGIFPFNESKWDMWYQKWIQDPNYWYRYLVNEENEYVGEVSYVKMDEVGSCLLCIIIESNKRNQGYGTEGLHLLMNEVKKAGFQKVYIDRNVSSIFKKNGFVLEQEFLIKQL